MNKQLFPTGRVLSTPGALAAFTEAYGEDRAHQAAAALLWRHVSGDWGDLCAEDRAANDRALEDGGRLLSAYNLPTGVRVWIITEAESDQTVPFRGRQIPLREATTFLLPEEY